MTEQIEQIQIILKKQQYGRNLKLKVSLFKKPYKEGDKIIYNVKTKGISVENLAELAFEFQACADMIRPTLKMRKHIDAQNSIVAIDISYKYDVIGNHKFSERYFCSDVWVDIHMEEFMPIQKLTVNDQKICAYNFEFNIVVHEILPKALKLYEDEEFTDFELHANDGTVAVHRAMLSVHSDFFNKMLKGDWKEKAEGHIKMDGVTVQTLQHIKDYMYLGALPDDGLETLLAVAGRFLMEELKVDITSTGDSTGISNS